MSPTHTCLDLDFDPGFSRTIRLTIHFDMGIGIGKGPDHAHDLDPAQDPDCEVEPDHARDIALDFDHEPAIHGERISFM